MVRLTEEMVVARTRISNLTDVKKFNCWGTDLTDVSILRDLKKVQVLSLSVNNIDTLADFQYCLDLRDLFVRKNNIKDLNEVCYLQNLPNLRNLWLDENPCSEQDGYRLAVLRALPNLEKLDDKVVTGDQVLEALSRGRVLIHPLEMDASSIRSDAHSPEEIPAEYIDDAEPEQTGRYGQSSDRQQRDYETRSVHHSTQDYQDTDRRNANWNTSPSFQSNYQDNSRYGYELVRNGETQNYDRETTAADDAMHSESRNILDNLSPATNTLSISKHYPEQLQGEVAAPRIRRRRKHSNSGNADDTPEDNRRVFGYSDNGADHEANDQRSHLSHVESIRPVSPRTVYSPTLDYSEEHRSSYEPQQHQQQQQYHHNHHQQQTKQYHKHQEDARHAMESDESVRSSVAAYGNRALVDRDEIVTRERESASAHGRLRHSEKDKCRFHYHRRPVTRNSNILSAVLCLLKELDYPSLEVVEMAVRNRMDELEE